MRRHQPPLSGSRLPNFLGVGPPRTATSTIYHVLANHPDVYMSPVKEINFFGCHGVAARLPVASADEYRRCFSGARGHSVVGEISPIYLTQEHSLEEISKAIPDVRILVTLRHPVSRAISQYLYHMPKHGYSDPDSYFREALSGSSRRLNVRFNWFHPVKNLQQSLYADALERTSRLFGPQQVKILFYENLRDDPETFFAELFQFLMVEAVRIPVPHLNTSTDAGKVGLTSEMRLNLAAFFSDDIKRVRSLVRDIPW